MKYYSFSIRGNHESDTGNPLPKIKKTYRQQWTPEARRYSGWKCYVQEAFMKSLLQLDFNVHVRYLRLLKKPIKLRDGEKAVMDTQCTGLGNGRFGHPSQDRAISLREAAIFQTFPRNYRFVEPGKPVITRHVAKFIGNAVPVRIGAVIGKSIKRHVEDNFQKRG